MTAEPVRSSSPPLDREDPLGLVGGRIFGPRLVATADVTLRTARHGIRATLSACVAIEGVVVPASAAATEATTMRRGRRAPEAMAR